MLTPHFFRKFVAGVEREDSPSSVISEWAQLTGCSVAAFTGGSWEKIPHTKGALLVAHVRVPEDLATKVCDLSGKRGLFATTLCPKHDHKPVRWITKEKEQSDEEYFRTACAQAQTEKVGVALRQQGPHHLGLIGLTNHTSPMAKRRAWEIYGAPSHWYQEHITEFLSSEGWKDIQVRKKLRRRHQHVWLVHATCPPFQNEDPEQATYWQYSDPQGEVHISITLEKRPAKKVPPGERLQAPKKKWTDPKSFEQLGNTASSALHSPSDVTPPIPEREDGKDRSPRRNSGKGKAEAISSMPPVIAEEVFSRLHPDWTFHDDGGTGDCGFRSIARSIAVSQNKDLTIEKIITEGSRLRTMATGDLIKHAETFGGFFAHDPLETPAQRDFQPSPKDFQDYCMIASRRNFWIDGLLLYGLAHRLGCVFTIFNWNKRDEAWGRHVVSSKYEKAVAVPGQPKAHTVCLALKDGHYRALLPADKTIQIPNEWFAETPQVARHVLRGSGAGSEKSTPDLSQSSLRNWFQPHGSQDVTHHVQSSPKLSLPAQTPLKAVESLAGGSQDVTHHVQSSPKLSLPAQTPLKAVESLAGGSGLSLPLNTPGREPSTRAASRLDLPPSPSVGSRKRKLSQARSASASKASQLSLAQAYSGFAKASSTPASGHKHAPPAAAKRPRSWHRTQVGQLWWTCDKCDFKVYWVAGVSTHSDARRQHLTQIHEVAPKDIPKHAPPKPSESSSARYYKSRWSTLLDICSARAWPGMHSLVTAKLSWKCSKCNSGRILSSQVAAQICPAYEGNQKSIPSLPMHPQATVAGVVR